MKRQQPPRWSPHIERKAYPACGRTEFLTIAKLRVALLHSSNDSAMKSATRLVLSLVVFGGLILLFISLDTTSVKFSPQMSIVKEASNKHSSASAYPMTVDEFLATDASTWTSPACKPHFLANGQPIKRIFFLHMRKAGGTVIRKYLKKVCKFYDIQFQAREGRKTVEHHMDFHHTLYITNLREPVARTISHYKYDQRWACTDLRNDSFVPTALNTKSSLKEFLHRQDNHTKKNGLWTCATNCYTRWATGNYGRLAKTCSSKLRRREVKRINEARDMLLNYNLIIVAEKLRDEKYRLEIEKMFGVPGLAREQVFAACAKPSAAANVKIPLHVSKDTRKRIERCNTPDSALYTQMTTCPNGFDFPKFNINLFG